MFTRDEFPSRMDPDGTAKLLFKIENSSLEMHETQTAGGIQRREGRRRWENLKSFGNGRTVPHDLIFFLDPDRHDDKFVLDELVRVRELCLLFYILTEKLRKSSSF